MLQRGDHMKRVFSTAAALLALAGASTATAADMTFDFRVSGFSGGGEVVGKFKGSDLNGDGYLSSFLFADPAAVTAAGLTPGINEVSFVEATFSGGVWDGGDQIGSVTDFTVSNDLTVLEQGPGFPNDLFFTFNYKIGSGLIGDDPFEGMLVGEAVQSFVFGVGPFLPSPEALGGFPSLTLVDLTNAASGTPCVDSMACVIMQTIVLDPDTGAPVTGGAAFSSQFVSVSQVPVPGAALLMAPMIAGAFGLKRRKRNH